MTPSRGSAADRRGRAASSSRSTARRARRRDAGARARASGARRLRPRRSGRAAPPTTCRRGSRGPSPHRRASARRRRAGRPRAGSSTWTATTWCLAATPASGLSQSRGPRKSDTTTTRPPRRAVAATNRSAVDAVATAVPGAWSVTCASWATSSVASNPSRPTVGATRRSVAPPNVTMPSRLPRWVARWPTAIATPSATSALRRWAVPNVIDGEVSSTSHVVSARSGTCTRTCGTVVRAVTFQSMRRTSSPG